MTEPREDGSGGFLTVTEVMSDGMNLTVRLFADKAGSEQLARLSHDVPDGSEVEWGMTSRVRRNPMLIESTRHRFYDWSVDGTMRDMERELRALAALLGYQPRNVIGQRLALAAP